MRSSDHLCRGKCRAQGVRHLRKGRQSRAWTQLPGELVEGYLAAIVKRSDLQDDALLPAQNLPGHDIGVVLKAGDQHLVAFLQESLAETGGHQVDRLGRAAREDDFVVVPGVEERLDLAPRRIIALGGS